MSVVEWFMVGLLCVNITLELFRIYLETARTEKVEEFMESMDDSVKNAPLSVQQIHKAVSDLTDRHILLQNKIDQVETRIVLAAAKAPEKAEKFIDFLRRK